jgi:hypothetical protein
MRELAMRTTAAQIERREAPIVSVDTSSRSVTVAISVEAPDRYSSIIKQAGLKFGSQSLPVLVGHSGPAIARTSGIWAGIHAGYPATFARIAFPQAGLIASADEEYARVTSGTSDSWSIGFYPLKTRMADNDLLEILEAEVVEVSSVPVPAQPLARTVDIHRQAPALELRQPSHVVELRNFAAPAIAEKRTDLGKITFQDFVVLSMQDGQGDYRGDIGPAREWNQELCRQLGGPPKRGGIRFPLGLLYETARQREERVRDWEKRQLAGEPLMSETLMRSLIDKLLDAMRHRTFLSRLGVRLEMATEERWILPSIATSPIVSNWIARDGDATLTAIPTFASTQAVPHELSTLVQVPRHMLLGITGPAAEIVRQEMSEAHLVAMERAYLYGDETAAPAGAQPVGLFRRIPVAAFPAAAMLFERDTLVEFVRPLEESPLEGAGCRWFFPNRVRRRLERTRYFPSGDLTADPDAARSDQVILPESFNGGVLIGYPAIQSEHLRSNLGTGNRQADLLFGRWDQTFWISWSTASVFENPFADSVARSGAVLYRILSDHDSLVRDVRQILRTEFFQHTPTP